MIAGTKRIFLNPVVLFLLGGIVLFFIYTEVSGIRSKKDNQIVVSEGQIELLYASFEKTWNRPPSEQELEAQVNSFIMDEVFFKEAVAMGLDKKDPAVKRRMRQIIEMMLDDYTTVYPTESQLQQYLSENEDEFRLPSRITFDHVYFKQEEKTTATEQLARLQNGLEVDKSVRGKMLMIPSRFEDESEVEIEKLFGSGFNGELFQLGVGEWLGPVASAYGWHLVKVEEKTAGEVPGLEMVRAQVEREWKVEQQKLIKEKQYNQMKSRYNISVNYPD